MAGFSLGLAGRALAQTLTVLHSFTLGGTTSLGNYTNSEGCNPYAGLISSGNTLYGTTISGGSSGEGTVFKINTDGTDFTVLHDFALGGSGSSGYYTNSDGITPTGGLILSGNTLYGTMSGGGSLGSGTVFAINTDGTGFTNLHTFTTFINNENIDGAFPQASLILSGNTLYGTTIDGGSSGRGTVFTVNTDGTDFTTLYSFAYIGGCQPYGGLVLLNNTLYGTTSVGGSLGGGTVFAINTDGTGFTDLHNFTQVINGANRDGNTPYGGLVLLSNTLYGTTVFGGSSGEGTVFKINTDGTDFTVLHNFTYVNGDGVYPYDGLLLSGNTLYGTASEGGSLGEGAVFKVNTDGTDFTTLYSFTGTDLGGINSDGNTTYGGLVLSGNNLYGTAEYGGISDNNNGNGTVFNLLVGPVSGPQLAILPYAGSVILTWPTNFTGFNLQSTTNLNPTNWSSVSQNPVVIGGQNVVINPITGIRKFYRLKK